MHVPKEKIKVSIIVDRFRIVGNIFRFPGARLIDIVNIKDTAFIAVTDAEIFSLGDGKKLQDVSFMAINRNAISFFYPLEEELKHEDEI